MCNLISDICENIKPSHAYTVAELVESLGLSRSAIYRYIDKRSMKSGYKRIANRRTRAVLGKDVIAFCDKYADLLYMYSHYNGRKPAARVSPGLSQAAKKKRPKWWKYTYSIEHERRIAELKERAEEEYEFDVARACRWLREHGKKVTVRAVQARVGGRTQVLCGLIREWKEELRLKGIA